MRAKDLLKNKIKVATSSILILLFLLFSFIYLREGVVGADKAQFWSSLSVISLLFLYITKTVKINKLYVFGLVSLALGDFFFAYDDAQLYTIGITFFMFYNLITIFLLIRTMGLLNKRLKILKRILPLIIVILSLLYFLLSNVINIGTLVLIFGTVVVSVLLISFQYYRESLKKSSAFMLAGIFLLSTSYAFAGMNKLLYENAYYSIIESLSYAVGISLITCGVTLNDYSYNKKILNN